MAQPAVDLPDPLNGSNLAGVANADDLLSQLAGDEIDRLLAESEGDVAPKAPSSVAVDLPGEPPPAAPSTLASPAAATTHAAQPTQASINAVLAQSEAVSPPPPQTPDRAPATESVTAPGPSAVNPSAAGRALSKSSSLLHDEPDDSPHASPAARAVPRPPRTGLLIRPLLWMNAPFAALSEPARELVGKLGLVTLINAVAVLAYVWIFVRHHR